MNELKLKVAKEAIDFIKPQLFNNTILGIGTGSTVNCFIEELKNLKGYFKGAVSSSNTSSQLLKNIGIDVYSLNDVNEIEFYIDGADEVSPENNLIKGGGARILEKK